MADISIQDLSDKLEAAVRAVQSQETHPRPECNLAVNNVFSGLDKKLDSILQKLVQLDDYQVSLVARVKEIEDEADRAKENTRLHDDRIRSVENFMATELAAHQMAEKERRTAIWRIGITIVTAFILSALGFVWVGIKMSLSQ